MRTWLHVVCRITTCRWFKRDQWLLSCMGPWEWNPMYSCLGILRNPSKWAALLQSPCTLRQKQNVPKRIALRASVPEMLKVTTLLYWQSSANLSPNFCCNMSWCKHGDMCFSALQHVVMQICSLRTFRLSYSQLSGPPNVQKPVWCLATSLVVQYKTPILEEHHLYWTRQLISSNNQQGSAGQNACYACCCFQIKELSQCSSAIPKSKNSHNVRLYDSVRQADQDWSRPTEAHTNIHCYSGGNWQHHPVLIKNFIYFYMSLKPCFTGWWVFTLLLDLKSTTTTWWH